MDQNERKGRSPVFMSTNSKAWRENLREKNRTKISCPTLELSGGKIQFLLENATILLHWEKSWENHGVILSWWHKSRDDFVFFFFSSWAPFFVDPYQTVFDMFFFPVVRALIIDDKL